MVIPTDLNHCLLPFILLYTYCLLAKIFSCSCNACHYLLHVKFAGSLVTNGNGGTCAAAGISLRRLPPPQQIVHTFSSVMISSAA